MRRGGLLISSQHARTDFHVSGHVEHDQTHGLGQTHYLVVRIKETYQGVIESCWMFASKGDLQTMSRYDMQITPRTWHGGISGN